MKSFWSMCSIIIINICTLTGNGIFKLVHINYIITDEGKVIQKLSEKHAVTN